MSAWGLADLERRVANMVKIGVIAEADHSARKIRVQAGGMTSAWLPWPAEVGRNFKRWRPLRVGQQVVMLAPSGELAQAVVVGMLYSSSVDAPANSPDRDLVEFDDGTRLEYDSAAHKLTATVKGSAEITTDTTLKANAGTDAEVTAGGNVNATAGAAINLSAPAINLTGAVTIAGPLAAGPGSAGGGATINGSMDIQSGTVTVSGGDVVADGKSLKGHTHTGDSGGTTSPPN